MSDVFEEYRKLKDSIKDEAENLVSVGIKEHILRLNELGQSESFLKLKAALLPNSPATAEQQLNNQDVKHSQEDDCDLYKLLQHCWEKLNREVQGIAEHLSTLRAWIEQMEPPISSEQSMAEKAQNSICSIIEGVLDRTSLILGLQVGTLPFSVLLRNGVRVKNIQKNV